MKTYSIKIKQSFSKIIELEAINIEEAILKINEINGSIDLVNSNEVEIDTSVDFCHFSELNFHNEFNGYLNDKAKETFGILSAEEISKIVFGGIVNAIKSFEIEKNDRL